MTHILHLGHQPGDIPGITGLISTEAGGFDPDLDVNAIRFIGSSSHAAPFAVAVPEPANDLWLGFRYVPPDASANNIGSTAANFLEFFDAAHNRLAQVRPDHDTNRYHAIAHGDASIEGGSSFTAPSGLAQWIDIRLSVGAQITQVRHLRA